MRSLFLGLLLCGVLIGMCAGRGFAGGIQPETEAYMSADLPAGSPIRLEHIENLRLKIDQKRAACNITPPFPWTPGNSLKQVKERYIAEMRDAIEDILKSPPGPNRTLNLSPVGGSTYTALTGSVVSRSHIIEISYAVKNARCCGDGRCDGFENHGNCSADCP